MRRSPDLSRDSRLRRRRPPLLSSQRGPTRGAYDALPNALPRRLRRHRRQPGDLHAGGQHAGELASNKREPVHPGRDRPPGQLPANLVRVVVAVAREQVVGVASELVRRRVEHSLDVARGPPAETDRNCRAEDGVRRRARREGEDARRRGVVAAEAVLRAGNFYAGVEDAQARVGGPRV